MNFIPHDCCKFTVLLYCFSVCQERIDQYLSEYELLDEFLFGLPQDDFNAKWVCIGWPHKIEIQMEQTYR